MTVTAFAIDMRDSAFHSDPQPVLHAVRARGRGERDVVGILLATHHNDCSVRLGSSALSRDSVSEGSRRRSRDAWQQGGAPPSR